MDFRSDPLWEENDPEFNEYLEREILYIRSDIGDRYIVRRAAHEALRWKMRIQFLGTDQCLRMDAVTDRLPMIAGRPVELVISDFFGSIGASYRPPAFYSGEAELHME